MCGTVWRLQRRGVKAVQQGPHPRLYKKLRAQKTPCKPPHLNSRFSYVSLLGLGYARSPPRMSTSARGSTIAPGRLAAES